MIYRLLILLGLALIGAALWLTLSPRQAEPVTAHSSGPARPDSGYSATDASLVETGADGLPLYTLQARRVQQDTDTNIINLSTVNMTAHDTHGGKWQARSDQAQVGQDAAQIDLSGSIDVFGTFAGNEHPVHVLTDILRVDTRTEVIQAPAAVTLTWAGMIVNARGLVINTKQSSIKLLANVHGQFSP